MAEKVPSLLPARKMTLKPSEVAKPLHIQRLEAALDLRNFIDQCDSVLNPENTSDSSSDCESKPSTEMSKGDRLVHGIVTTKEERKSDRLRLFNFETVGQEREWLKDILMSSSSSDSSSDEETTPAAKEKYIKGLLKEHVLRKKYSEKFYKNPKRSRYMYYGSGLLSPIDKYPERNKSNSQGYMLNAPGTSGRGRRGRGVAGGERGGIRGKKGRRGRIQDDGDMVDGVTWKSGANNYDSDDQKELSIYTKPTGRARKKMAMSTEGLTVRRRRLWTVMAKKEVGRVQRARAATHREQQQLARRLASLAARSCRQKAMQSQKNMKETVWRCKRLSREMQSYWRRYDRAERETRRRMERQAEEQRKMDIELMEAKRQRRKLNFLITQTELYAHFMQRKLNTMKGDDCDDEGVRILSQLDEERDPRLAAIDNYDSEEMKARAESNARAALAAESQRTQSISVNGEKLDPSTYSVAGDYIQPSLFKGTLKGYQLKGMNWLANLYDQGISGILADEMGLGKTVQCIAFLCHAAERLGIWGPFLVVSPASTLHNWQQEMEKFAPDFKVVPYWGSPSERKILRQFWERRDLHTRTAAFHVVITSYQIVVSDLKYLNRVNWQYMILDEAQAIKSSASMRWKLLLGFSCRNRLLLSGTPIQNSMAELWALLHFIMPTLFDSHDEFNEWFSKDIESHAENKSTMDEKHLSRLHMILKPFMLRRIKKDVENELSDKIEIMVHCPLTIRQKLLYIALKKKIKIEELLHYTIGGGDSGHNLDKSFTSNLMNLVMQFRKVCNHPELFERRDVKSPLYLHCDDYHIPKQVAEECILTRCDIKCIRHLLYNRLSVLHAEWIHRSQFYSWMRFVDLSPMEFYRIMLGGWLFVMQHILEQQELSEKRRHRQEWWYDGQLQHSDYYARTRSKHLLLVCLDGRSLRARSHDSDVWSDLLFVRHIWPKVGGPIYSFLDHTIHYMPETVEHRSMRLKASRVNTELSENMEVNIDVEKCDEVIVKSESTNEFIHVERDSYVRCCEATMLPGFLYCPFIKAQSKTRVMFASSRLHAYHNIRHEHGECRTGIQLVDTLTERCRHPDYGWHYINTPDKNQLVSDAGKLTVLDSLLRRLKESGHRVLIYSQMTKMIDLLEEYMWHRKHKYMRLDGSSKISARRDMVADFQQRSDIFVFLLSTRAGGLGINLTAADTVIFYDSDWNPTVDQQAMDRAHRLGQTKQVTVYRLICKGTIEERIMQRAREKSEIQRMVISGGNLKPDTLKPKEVVSLLLDDEEIELKYRQKAEEKKLNESTEKDRKRKLGLFGKFSNESKKPRSEVTSLESGAPSPDQHSDSSNDTLMVDTDISETNIETLPTRSPWSRRGANSRRGRPRGSRHIPSGATRHQVTTPADPAASSDASSGVSTQLAEGAALLQSDEPLESVVSPQSSTNSRRGPGRPRIRPGLSRTPQARGLRRPRRPREPLLVPLAGTIQPN